MLKGVLPLTSVLNQVMDLFYIYRYKQLIVFLFFPVDGCNENGIGV